ICHCEALFKLENLQMTGSFKERGALNRLLALTREERRRGVIAASAGNHAQGLAYHAMRLDIPATIVMPARSPMVKIRSTEHWGARVILHGDTFDDAYQYCQQIIAEENRVFVHPFDDPLVVEGQGTVAVELLNHEASEDIDTVLVPVGGGGLIAGMATYIKDRRPDIRIIGIEEANCNAMGEALAHGQVVQLPPRPVIADGIAVRRVSAANLETVQHLVDDMISVDGDEIANAIMLMLEIEKLVIEASAAVTLAALVNHKVPGVTSSMPSRKPKVASIVSGGNIDVNELAKVINRGLSFDGRIARLDTVIPDRPGALEKLLGVFREVGANVLEVHHHRYASTAPAGTIGVTVTVETRNPEHVETLRKELVLDGFQLLSE
ncbi:MAG: threonine ammonia-lyase, partial [Proteobacteria bacterium]|nr:threonine ammonia-lyase [Pseudomonadota bacterium]